MLKLFKAKSLKNTNFLTSNRNERTQEKAILKEGIGTSREATCTRGGRTRASLFGTYTPSKMGFSASGRSMVEMLGVLAIIGVLSIGGIQGYTLAMRKYRANEILNIVQKYAMVLYSSCQQAMEKNPEIYGIGPDNVPYYSTCFGWRDTSYCEDFWYCPGIKFTDAGLGALPSGVLEIGWDTLDTAVMVNPGYFHGGGVSIKSLSSGDAVVITVQFETKELCEATAGIVGVPDYEQGTIGADSWACNKEGYGNGYYLAITTMMN